MKRYIALIGALALFASACEEQPASGSGANIVEDDDAAAAEAPDEEVEPTDDEEPVAAADEPDAEDDPNTEEGAPDEGGPLGTRDNPLQLGTRIELAGWTLTVTEVTKDATDLVMAENEFNDPAADGRQFVMFHVDASYEGDESGDPWLDFAWAIVGAGGNTYGASGDFEDYCGVIPNALDEQGETYPGGSVEGNVCYSVAADQVDGATIRIEESFSFDDTRAFFALD